MLLHKSVEHDSRVRRAARALAEAGHEVTVLHLPRLRGELDGPLDGFSVRSVTPPAWVRRRLPSTLYRLVFFVAFVRAARRLRPDIVHAHDAAMLAPGWAVARFTSARLVYDSHEYAAGVPYRDRAWTLLVTALERLLIRRCTATITVSDGIADRLQARYALRNRPVVVRNVPDPAEHDPDFEAPDLRDSLGIAPGTPLVLHLGAVARDRGCETLVRAMAHLPEAHLLFLGADDSAYATGLREIARAEGVGERTHFRPSVPVAQIRAHTRQASVGVSLLEDTCENHRLALPNKVFEYIEAGVPVVVSDLPELRGLVEREECGQIAPSGRPAEVAGAIRAVVGGRTAMPPDTGSWEEESSRLLKLYRRFDISEADRRALVLVRNPVTNDARVLREARLLARLGVDVRIVGAARNRQEDGESLIEGIAVRRLYPRLPAGRPRRLAWRRRRVAREVDGGGGRDGVGARSGVAIRAYRALITLDWYRRAIAEVRRHRPTLVHCNDYNTMWIGLAAKAGYGAKVVYDSHELWPDRNLRPEARPWLIANEALFVRFADCTITTSPGYARVIGRRYRVDAPQVIRNVPDLPPRRISHNHSATPPLAVYFGALTHGRGLEEAIAALPVLPDLRLRLVGPEVRGFDVKAQSLARDLGVADRLELCGPVRPDEAETVMGDADVGLALIQPVCLSYVLTLPNKVFEYALMGLPILATDLPVMRDFVRENDIGITVPPGNADALADGLRRVLHPEANRRFRRSATEVGRKLTWEHESTLLAEVYRRALGG